jgi:magnesium transporter
MSNESNTLNQNHRQAVLTLLEKRRVTEELVHKQDTPHQNLVETLIRKQNLARIQLLLGEMVPADIAALLEDLSEADQLFIWDLIDERRKEQVLPDVSVSILHALGKRAFKQDRARIKAFELFEGRMREIPLNTQDDLVNAKPIWVDLVDPTFEERTWVGDAYGIELPDPDRVSDLESSARFYVEENGDIHLRSDFLLDKEDVSRNVGVNFILHHDILFSVRKEELPVFRLQRLRAFSQPHYVSDARDVLLDLYAADVEYSADALEDIYQGLERVGSHVLSKQMTDEEAARMLSDIGQEEDLNGRIRRNVLDTRRAVSFLTRSRVIERYQLEDAQQILRDIESLDGHTTFLFGKLNFLMDATVGFININQNKVIKRLTVLSVVFMPLNVIAGIGGMSEFSSWTRDIAWPISYAALTVAMFIVAWITFELLRFAERREKLRLIE